jgi:putative transposase
VSDPPLGEGCRRHPKALQEEVHARLHAIFDAPDPETARALLARFAADFEQHAPDAVATLERGFEDATAILALPVHYRRRLPTTNGGERLNEEIRRRERVIRILPNRESAVCLLEPSAKRQWDSKLLQLRVMAEWHAT